MICVMLVATDANAQMALLQFISGGLSTVRVPTSVHADHLITAKHGDRVDMLEAERVNKEVYKFLESACAKVRDIESWECLRHQQRKCLNSG
jgi:aconitase A